MSAKPPPDWSIKRLSEIADVIVSNVDKKSVAGEKPVSLCNYTDVYDNNDITADMTFMEASAKISEIEKFTLKAGDIIITKDSETPDDIGVPTVVREDMPGVLCGYHLSMIRLTADEYDPVFIARQIASHRIARYFGRQANGTTRYGLNIAPVEATEIWLAPSEEQRRIAEILDTADEAIQKTEALIAKLKQIKAGLLHDLLTRGIDENGELRNTSNHKFEWRTDLTPVPTGWAHEEIENRLLKIIDYRGKTPQKTESGLPLLTAKNVRDGYLDVEPREFISEESYGPWMTRGIPDPGDVLFTTEAPLGNVAQMPDYKAALAQRVLTLQVDPKMLDKNFLFWMLHWPRARRSIEIKATGSTVLGVKQSTFRKIKFWFPDIPEQQEIALRMKSQDDAIRREIENGEKLKLLKAGLMHDLLTGKKRVNQPALATA